MAPLTIPDAEFLAGLTGTAEGKPCKVLDIAAGHGMYGVTVAKRNPHAQVGARDVSSERGETEWPCAELGVGQGRRTGPGPRECEEVWCCGPLHHPARQRIRVGIVHALRFRRHD